jgi:hypothetical protein
MQLVAVCMGGESEGYGGVRGQEKIGGEEVAGGLMGGQKKRGGMQ